MATLVLASGSVVDAPGTICADPDGNIRLRAGGAVQPVAPAATAEQALAAVALLGAQLDAARIGVVNGFLDGFANQDGINGGLSNYAFSVGKCSKNAGAIATPIMTGPTTPSGEADASSEFSATYAAWKAFDRTNAVESDAWLPSGALPQWLRYRFPSAVSIGSYTVTTRAYPAAYPTDWEFQGSNDGSSWTTLHTVTGSGLNSPGQTSSVYNIPTPGSYLYYRINFTAKDPPGDMGIGELTMYTNPGDLDVVSTSVTGQTPELVQFTALVKGSGWTFEIDTGSGWQTVTMVGTDAGGGLTQYTGQRAVSGTFVTCRARSTDATAELHGWGVFW